jgi:hypothetical protein
MERYLITDRVAASVALLFSRAYVLAKNLFAPDERATATRDSLQQLPVLQRARVIRCCSEHCLFLERYSVNFRLLRQTPTLNSHVATLMITLLHHSPPPMTLELAPRIQSPRLAIRAC